MANTDEKQQGDGGRFVGTTWQDLLDLETVDVPEYLRIQNNPDMGDEDLSVDRYISQEFFNKEKEEMWPRVWQMACREEEIPEPGDHHVYWIIDRSVIVTRTPSGESKDSLTLAVIAVVACATSRDQSISSAAPSMAPPGTWTASSKAFPTTGISSTLLTAT